MLEAPTFLVSKEMPNSRDPESQWIYNTIRLMELSNKKLRQKVEEKKADSGNSDDEETQTNVVFLFASNCGQNNDQNAGVNFESGSLIPQLDWDASIYCLLKCSRSDYGSIASLNRTFRSLIRSGELYRMRRMMGIVEHWVYFSCSLHEWEAFDPNRGRWIELPEMVTNQCFLCSDKESLAVGTELLVFGKEIMCHAVYKYSLLTNTWTTGPEMNVPRCLFGSASLGEIAILAGGCDKFGKALNKAELYNSETGKWEILPL